MRKGLVLETQVGIGIFVARTGGASLKESRLSSGFSRIFRPRVSP